MKKKKKSGHKKYWIVGVILFLVAIRAVAPSIIHERLNKFLANYSEVHQAHVGDFDMSILRMAYRFENVEYKFKGSQNLIGSAESIDVALAWRDLFSGKLKSDIRGDGVKFIYSKDYVDSFKEKPKDQKTAGKKIFPLQIDRLDLKNSQLLISDIPGLPDTKYIRITDIIGRMSNVMPSDDIPFSMFSAKGKLLGKSPIRVIGQFNFKTKPIQWEITSDLQDFNLTEANEILMRKMPMSFERGSMDLIAELKSENGRIDGQLKPQVRNVKMLGRDEQLSFKQVKWEVLAAAANAFFRRAEDKTVATVMPFSYADEKFEIDADSAIQTALDHGLNDKPVEPGPENQYVLKNSTQGKNLSLEAKQVALENQTGFVTEVTFPPKSDKLSPDEQQRIKDLIKKAEQSGEIKKVHLITWGDGEDSNQTDIVDRRNNQLSSIIDAEKINPVDMTEKPTKFSKLFKTQDYEIKNSLSLSAVNERLRASRSIIMVETKNE